MNHTEQRVHDYFNSYPCRSKARAAVDLGLGEWELEVAYARLSRAGYLRPVTVREIIDSCDHPDHRDSNDQQPTKNR